MLYSRVKWIYRVVLVVTCIFCFSLIASATSISSLCTDETSGWSKWDDRHMGGKYTTYSYSNSIIESEFSNYVEQGINMWGNSISCTQVDSGAEGTICASYLNIGATASVSSTFDSSGHVTSWTLTIYSALFNTGTSEGKTRTIAHEIGHVYGLGHVDDSSNIMYHTYSVTKSVTAADLRGMNLMTHSHNHSSTTSYNLEWLGTIHKKRCDTCLAYEEIQCTETSNWHSGQYHYFQYNCICGNYTLRKIPCNPTICPTQSVKP